MTYKFLYTGKKIGKLFFIYAIIVSKADIFGVEVA